MKTIIQNLRLAIAIVESEPEALFDLGLFVCRTRCGTLHCTAGLLATHPHFQALGWHLDPESEVHSVDGGTSRHRFDKDFGANAYSRLFEPRHCGAIDAYLLGALKATHEDAVTDKQLALARLQHYLAESEAC